MSVTGRRGIHAEIVELLGHRIVGGEIAEGETLNVAALERELGVSLTVVREAMKVLTTKGLVDARQKRGTYVQPRASWHMLDADVIRWRFAGKVDHGFLDALHEVREIVEPAAARLAAARRTPHDVELLRDALHAMTAAADAGEAVQADVTFHRVLLGAAHNEVLEQMEVVLEAGLANRDRLVHGAPHVEDAVPSHAAVVAAIEAGDTAAAEHAVRKLLSQAQADSQRLTDQGDMA
jgi:GntR family transcriptional regulator, galactonate operon transcriptional repressor